jgi:hypothetical protein
VNILLALSIALSANWALGAEPIQSCKDCNQLTNCQPQAKQQLDTAVTERDKIKANNAAAGKTSSQKAVGGLQAHQQNPMLMAKSNSKDCKSIGKGCREALTAVSQKIAGIQKDLIGGIETLNSCNEKVLRRPKQEVFQALDNEQQRAGSEKAATDREVANCARAEAACAQLEGKNAGNADRMNNGQEQASAEQQKKEGEKKEGGGSPPGGGGGGAPPPPQEQKPEEQPKTALNCKDQANIEKPECKAERCQLAQYKDSRECGADCSKPENLGHPKCVKTVNPTVAK